MGINTELDMEISAELDIEMCCVWRSGFPALALRAVAACDSVGHGKVGGAVERRCLRR